MKRTAALLVTVIAYGLISSAFAANPDDLAAKGYRWVTVDGFHTVALLETISRRLPETAPISWNSNSLKNCEPTTLYEES